MDFDLSHNKYRHLLFRLGYLITDIEIAACPSPYIDYIRKSWKKKTLGPLKVFHHPDLQAHEECVAGTSVLCLGTILDPLNDRNNPQEIAREMASLYAASSDSFFDYLDILSGRFVVLVVSGSQSFVVQDAAGTKTAFFDTESGNIAVSSHSSLVAELLGREIAPWVSNLISRDDYKRGSRHFPGALTPYPGILLLTPNTLLDLSELKVKRFFPRVPLTPAKLDTKLVSEVSFLLKKQVDLLTENNNLSISLTGGIDSRTTLAAAHGNISAIECYTYVAAKSHEVDAEIAAKICERLGVKYSLYRVDEKVLGDDLEEYMEVWRKNTSYMRAESQGEIGKALLKLYPAGSLHLKSNVSEVGRASYRHRSKRFLPNRVSPEILARCYGIASRSNFVRKAFADFVSSVDLSVEKALNYDIYDLFHWEHRMGTWQSLQIMDLDIAQDTFILFNNRHLLNKLLSVPLADRLQSRTHKEVIRFLWPELLEFPFADELKPWYRKVPKETAKKVKYSLEAMLYG